MFPEGNELRTDMVNKQGVHQYLKYKKFQVGNQNTRYLVLVSKYSGTAANVLSFAAQNEMKFTLREKCPNTKFFLVRIQENTDQKNSLFGYFSRSVSTFYFDNDPYSGNFGRFDKSGCWFSMCLCANLNGVYRHGKEVKFNAGGIHWSKDSSFNGHGDSLIYTEMKVRCWFLVQEKFQNL